MCLFNIVARYSLERLFSSVFKEAKLSMTILLNSKYLYMSFDTSISVTEFSLLNAKKIGKIEQKF